LPVKRKDRETTWERLNFHRMIENLIYGGTYCLCGRRDRL
jgi:hypothetical protein